MINLNIHAFGGQKSKCMEDKKEINAIILETVQELINKMGLSGEAEIKNGAIADEESIVCNIKTKDSSLLIGQYGVNLQAFQHITRLLVRKKTEEKISLIVDVNSYREEKNESIEKIAMDSAEQAIREKRAVVMRPMTPYERRLVHLVLSKKNQVKTESIGEGESRKVIVKPAEII